jgi:hypothetical protein
MIFTQIETVDGAQIKLTAEHFIYLVDCDDQETRYRRKVFAKDVRLGDCLLQVVLRRTGFRPMPVISITQVSGADLGTGIWRYN